MQELFQRYVNYLVAERNCSPYTVRNYTTDLQGSKNIQGYFGFLQDKGITTLDQADRYMVREYLSYLAEKKVNKASIARKLSAMRSFYRFLTREEILSVNPLEEASSPKLDKRLPTFLTSTEITRLIEIPDAENPYGQRDRAILELLYASGLRISEVTSLDTGRINLESREIRVVGKGSKERIVLIGEPAAEALKRYIREGRKIIPLIKLPKGAKPPRSKALFVNNQGGRLSDRSIQKLMQKYVRLAGIEKDVHPHTVRHTFATHMLDGGADLRVVQELLGHSNLSTTQIYTHISKKRAKEVYLSAHPMAKGDQDDDDNEQ